MEYARREVHGPLAEAVRELWFLRGPAPTRFERIFPMTDAHLIVNLAEQPYRVLEGADAPWRTLDRAFCSGLRSRFVVSESPDRIVNAGAVVRPDGLRLLGLDPAAVASAISSQSWLDEVAAQGANAAAEVILEALEQTLTGRLRPDGGPDPVVRDAIERLELDPSQGIATIAAAHGVGHPSFVARFRRATGSTPKRFAELARFHQLIDRMPVATAASWSDLAVEAGYYDQSHVIRDFKRFAGFTPADYHRRVRAAGADAARFVPDPEAAFR